MNKTGQRENQAGANWDSLVGRRRADWTFLGDFDGKTVVEVGCGDGAVSLALALRGAGLVLSVDSDIETAASLAAVAGEKAIGKVVPLCADAAELPLAAGSVDAIIVIDRPGPDHRPLQPRSGSRPGRPREFLADLHGFLREGGELWLGVQNRFGPFHRPWEGGRSLSRRGHRRALEKAGFSRVDFGYVFPDCATPSLVVFGEGRRLISRGLERIESARWSKRFGIAIFKALDRINCASLFSPSFYIRARK